MEPKRPPKERSAHTAASIARSGWIISLVVALVGFVVSVLTVTRFLDVLPGDDGSPVTTSTTVPRTSTSTTSTTGLPVTDPLEARVAEIERQVARLAAGLERLSSQPSPPSALSHEVSSVQAKVNELDANMARLSSAINGDPERAVQLPLLRKEVEHLNEEVDDQGDLFKWIIGTVVIVSVAQLAVAISGRRAAAAPGS